jgi:hypothetical protein
MMERYITDEAYLRARKEGRWYVWNFSEMVMRPRWEDLLENIARSAQRHGELGQTPNLGFVGYHADRIPNVGRAMRELSEATDPTTVWTAHLFLSFSEDTQGYGRHKDDNDLWFWQCYGSTQWRVEHPDGDFEGELCPGQWIYVPRELYHTVKPLGPRASISIGNHYNTPKNNIKLF